MQLDLFEEQTTHLTRARNALRALDLRAAREEFEACLARYPQDEAARRGLARATWLLDRLAELEAEAGDPVAALVQLEGDLDETTRQGWHLRLAREAERRLGPAGAVAGRPAALHWLAGGKPEQAERSLREALQHAPDDARLLAYLGDVLFLRDAVGEARASYRRAFATDPRAVDLPRLADPAVQDLPAVAGSEYEAPGDGTDWVAAVGTVEGIFLLPAVELPLIDGAPAAIGDEPPGRAFYRQLLRERAARSHAEQIRARRQMKALCPKLLAAHLERRR